MKLSSRVQSGRQWITGILYFASLATSLSIGALMVASHVPFQQDHAALRKLVRARVSNEKGSWTAVHILAAGCACSRNVAEHLVERGRLSGLQEAVILAGKDAELLRILGKAKVATQIVSPEELTETYNLQGAPWLVFVDPAGDIAYTGGYSAERNTQTGFQDVRIWNDLQRGLRTTSLPAYGCAVGRKLQRTIDPLGWKYRSEGVTN